MKHTKNMIIKESEESRELTLYIVNDGSLHESIITPIIKNLQKKAKAGKLDKVKAIDAFYYAAQAGAKKYCKDFARVEDAPQVFDVTARYTTAAALFENYEDQINE